MTPTIPAPVEPTLVETVIEAPGWAELGLPELAEAAGQATLRHLALPPEGFAICVMGCDDARIRELNGAFRDRDAATNVLSWPSVERGAGAPGQIPAMPEPGSASDPEELGDLALAFETCRQEAAAVGRPVATHVSHLLVHGILHLLGYDHESDADATLMERLEVEILAAMGFPDPYQV